ncbi:hypothetical protein QUF76_05635 [Desulfobacterales bacterium HSG16]|nr:hypothetical protein [Desulfobacterales bacterium HSG16]
MKSRTKTGLDEVRNYREKQLKDEISVWVKEIESARQVIPEVRALIVTKIGGRSK